MSDAIIDIGKDHGGESDTNFDKPVVEKPAGKPHHGKPCTIMEISPKCKYLVTYSEEDSSFVGWDIESTDEGRLKPDAYILIETGGNIVTQIVISDDKKLAYVYSDRNYLSR